MKIVSNVRGKFNRVFKRLIKINRFAQNLNHLYAIDEIDFSMLTSFNVKKMIMINKGENIFDLPEIKNENIVNHIQQQIVIPPELVANVKNITKSESELTYKLTKNLNRLNLNIKKKVNWKKHLKKNPSIIKKLQILTQIYFKDQG